MNKGCVMGSQREGFWGRAWRPVLVDSLATPAAEPDWAEMGTAFGLDASLGLAAPHAPVSAPTKGESGTSEGLWAANRLNGRSVI